MFMISYGYRRASYLKSTQPAIYLRYLCIWEKLKSSLRMLERESIFRLPGS